MATRTKYKRITYSKCRSCGAKIIWCTNAETGKKMPLDADPHPEGNVIAWQSGDTAQQMCRVMGKREDVGRRNRYVSHFKTCPEADSWRKS